MKHNQHNVLPDTNLRVEDPLFAVQFTPERQPDGSGEYAPKLLPGERLMNVYRPPITESADLPSAEEALMRLTDAPSLDQVGEFGPSVGSRAMRENESIEELKLYEVLFGRDSLIVADFVADQHPELLRTTVVELSKYLGTGYDSRSEQEPGRVPHEVRNPDDPIAVKITAERGVAWPLYTSVDATPLYISAVAGIAKRTQGTFLNERYADVEGNMHTVRSALDRSVGWLERRLGNNPEGLLESKATTGIVNQSWKDSLDSYMHADGKLANSKGGVASVEVQALAYDALLDAAEVYRSTGAAADTEHAMALEANAARLSDRVMKSFWVDDERGGYFALGTDRDEHGHLRPLKVRSSNMGHLLDSRLLDGNDTVTQHRKEALVRTLFGPDMLAAGGIRTLSDKEYRFRPGAYHNGSVWLWDTYKIARGLSRQGYDTLAAELENRILRAVQQTKRYPEFVRGDDGPVAAVNEFVVEVWDEARKAVNPLEQPPQEIQAWTVAAVLAIRNKRSLADGELILSRSMSAQPFERQILRDIAKRSATRPVGALAVNGIS